MMAEFRAALYPPRIASEPPVKKPAITKDRSIHGHQNIELCESRHTRIVRVLLLSEALDRAVERREQTTPHAKVSAEDGRPRLDRCDGSYASLAVGTVSVTLNTVPDCATDTLSIMSVATTTSTFEGALHPCKKHLQNRTMRP